MNESFYLCHKPGCGGCPKVDIDVKTKQVIITFDDGTIGTMTLDEFKQLQDHDMPSVQE